MCDYDLRGLTEPRCPECGFTFEWPDLLDPTRRKHRYLFEHHPERNVWSFLRTALGGLLPWRFWRSLRPEQPSNLRRLALYWVITVCGVLTLHVGNFAMLCVNYHKSYAIARWRMETQVKTPQGMAEAKDVIAGYGSVQAYLDDVFPLAPSRAFFATVWSRFRDESTSAVNTAGIACFLALPWVTAMSLMVFQATMRRTRVRGDHVLRSCLYSFDGGWWFGLLTAGCFAATLADSQLPRAVRLAKALPAILGLLSAALLLSGVVKLQFAYRRYMRFPHAVGTVVLALIMTFLLLTTIVVNVPGIATPIVDVLRSLHR
jgi:hypothetical protein